jgi:DNA invertase Pin-like site-specific DNA recombinase
LKNRKPTPKRGERTLAKPLEDQGASEEPQPYVFGYARVSMADQNPQLQIDALTAAGANVIYSEQASGASGADRPFFAKLMREAREGDTVLVWKLDRLGRSTREVLETFKTLDERGVKIRVLTQPGMDTTTEVGRLIVTIMAAVAELERDFIVERTAAGLAAAKAKGRFGGRRSKVSDEQILAAYDEYGTAGGARHVKLSKVQFLRRIQKVRGS